MNEDAPTEPTGIIVEQCHRCMRAVYLGIRGVDHVCQCVRCAAPLAGGEMADRYCARCREHAA